MCSGPSGGDRGHTVTFPARAYAELLGLDDPEHKGQRRVRESLTTFEDDRLITLKAQPGHPKTVVLLREDGAGEPYDRPGKHFEKAADGTEVEPAESSNNSVHQFVRLGPEFWTQGWVQVLSAPAIAVLLAMLVVTTNGKRHNQWVSQSERRLYGLSDDTWTRGTAELVDHGILAVRRAPVSRDPFDWKRRRNTYTLILERLERRPDIEVHHDAATNLEPALDPARRGRIYRSPAQARPTHGTALEARRAGISNVTDASDGPRAGRLLTSSPISLVQPDHIRTIGCAPTGVDVRSRERRGQVPECDLAGAWRQLDPVV